MARVIFADKAIDGLAACGLATDGAKGYCIFPSSSNYHGMHAVLGDARYKILHGIAPQEAELERITPHEKGFTLHWHDGSQLSARMPSPGTLSCDATGSFLLTFDCKRLHDESDVGRAYTLKGAGDAFILRYRKHHDDRIADDNIAYEVCIAISTDLRAEPKGTWREVPYPYDDRRGTAGGRWIYDALALSGSGRIRLAIGRTQDEALARLRKMPRIGGQEPLPLLEAPRAALRALRSNTGIMAGLPWFHQEWSRDELIAMTTLTPREQESILDKWYSAVRPDGTLPAIYPDQGLTSADAPGWLGKRTLDLLAQTDVSNETLARWRDASGRLVDGLKVRDGLIWSGVNETWMDTAWQDDGRAGARIEIQALALALIDAHMTLCARTKTPVVEKRVALHRLIAKNTVARMHLAGRLIDGLNQDGTPDHVVRPNLFIAWYVQPRLLARHQWAEAFDAALPTLWLQWGGLSSIAADDYRYAPHDSGEDSRAYHRGDSWYWINNIAAMALHGVGLVIPAKQLLKGSVRDLTQGIAGHASEISSAAVQEPMGCWAQAWSAATLAEALRVIR